MAYGAWLIVTKNTYIVVAILTIQHKIHIFISYDIISVTLIHVQGRIQKFWVCTLCFTVPELCK